MVDLLDRNAQAPNRDAEIDDPLAELARIIGYERPADRRPAADDGSQSNEFDLEAELMRELDVPQIPAIDEFDLLEADDAAAEAEMAASADDGYFRTDPDYPAAQDQPWLEPSTDDLLGWEPAEELVEQEVSPSFVEDEEPEALDAAEPASATDLEDPWAASDLDIEPELEFQDAPAASEPAWDEPGQVIKADFGGQAAAQGGIADDDVLADMFRFELPARQAGVPQTGSAPAGMTTASAASGSGQQDSVSDRDQDPFGAIVAGDDLPDADLDGGAAEPDFAADAFETHDAPVADAVVADNRNAPAMDFEDFLSTELEAFEQNLSVDGARKDRTDDVVDAAHDADLEADAGHGAWDDASAEAGDSVFDEAAEELLADIADDDDLTSVPEEVSADPDEAWPADTLEDAVAEELDEELEDLVATPDPLYDPFTTQSDTDDLDFDLDLDQVLADAAVELGSEWAEPELSAPRDLPQDEGVESWQAVPVAVARDEMAEAFLGLVPADNSQARDAAPATARMNTAAQPVGTAGAHRDDDWLDGFETTEATEQSGPDGYYFDAQLISEPEVTVEAVADIDVPELVHDEPQVVEPDYDTDIEREFASIVDVSDAETGAPIATDYAATEEWGRPDPAARYEISDDYVALERELGVTPSGYSYQDTDANPDGLAYTAPEHEDIHEEPAQRGQGSRGSVLALAVLGFAVLAGAGALGWSMLSGDDTVADGGPRIIRADTEPVKVLPENPGGVTVPNQDKAVYDRVAGSDASSPGQPSLVNTAEEPVDVVQRTLDPEILPLEGRDDPSVKSEDRLAAGGSDADGAGEAASAPVVSPRRVRTMIVKPDGSIVAREEPEPALEPQAALAEPTGADAMTAEPATEAAVAAELVAPVEQAAVAPADAPPALAPGAAADVPATDQSIAPVRVVTTQPVRAPVPQNRPADQPVTVVGTVTQGGDVANPQTLPAATAQPEQIASAPAAAAPAAAPATAAPAANPGGYYMQIASQPTAEGAQASWQALSSRYNAVIGGRGVDIQRADIPGKGVFHRVRIPAGSRDEANALCARYKSAGGSCFVSR
ncbi:MAG: SPOR domain-containing protein [Hoeflea sp.]|uniref:SPOR domain-containing protein n=1 Tax=Hoeflea sp. TaxID=1940281 RepID=UPI002731FEB4|nr:SPOR domain-containing protein [Hoeflea sp.]MDP2120145.1 SPOR domain-containing protein [Hoeflea sp.]